MISDDFFESLQQQHGRKLPFVGYRKPSESTVHGILQQTNTLYFTTGFTEKGFVFSPFDDNNNSVLMPLDFSEAISTTFIIPAKAEIHSYPGTISIESKQQHVALINKGINAIINNQLNKVVVSRQETVHLSETNPISIFKSLLESYAPAFVYCWYHPKVGLWLGATPETLIKIEGSRFSIMALAGTQNYNGLLNVVWQNKEKQEQQFVTDFIVEHLKPFVENLKISETKTIKAGNLLHLKTKITAHLKKEISNLEQLLRGLHPTPAVCGSPKLEAKQFILDNEGYNREFYTGFLGELNFENRTYSESEKSSQLYVNLRCMQIQDGKALIYVGGGITKTSNPESEWEETVFKTQTIKNALPT